MGSFCWNLPGFRVASELSPLDAALWEHEKAMATRFVNLEARSWLSTIQMPKISRAMVDRMLRMVTACPSRLVLSVIQVMNSSRLWNSGVKLECESSF